VCGLQIRTTEFQRPPSDIWLCSCSLIVAGCFDLPKNIDDETRLESLSLYSLFCSYLIFFQHIKILCALHDLLNCAIKQSEIRITLSCQIFLYLWIPKSVIESSLSAKNLHTRVNWSQYNTKIPYAGCASWTSISGNWSLRP
jgi:hypothetical protein